MNVRTAPSRAKEARTTALGRDLSWLTGVLWPEADVVLSPTRVPPGRRVGEAFAVIPTASHPRLLVPFSSPALAEPAMRRYDDGMSAVARAGRSLGWRLAASSVGWTRFPPLVVFFDREPRPDELLTQHLRSVLDRPDVVTAISFGPPRPNRKPVVQAMTLEGEVLGFGKVGWNDPTRALIRTEAAALRRWGRVRPQTFRVPRLMHEGPWRDHSIAVTSPIPTDHRLTGRPGRMPSPEVTREIARSGGVSLMPLASTPWWRSVLDRGASGGEPTRVVLRWLAELHGRRLMWHGSWHGDWAPQNMATVEGVLHVWDWERTLDGVPLGLDPLHFCFQLVFRSRANVSRAARVALARSAPALRALGVPSEDDALLMACYLAELLVRFEEGRRFGVAMRSGMPEALLAELRRWVARA